MSIKKVLLKKSVSGTVYDIYTKTSADIVEYSKNGWTGVASVKDALDSLKETSADVYTKTEVDDAMDDLYNRIMGIDPSSEEGQTIAEAFDTIKEIAEFLADNENYIEAIATLQGKVSTLEGTVGDSTSGLVKDVDDLQTAVGDSTSGLVKDVDDLQAAVGDSTSGLIKEVNDLKAVGATKTEASNTNGNIKINGTETTVYDDTALAGRVTTAEGKVSTLEGTVGDSTSGLVKDVTDLKAVGATKTESSNTNGNIKINNVETTVYDDTALAGRVSDAEDDIDALQTAVGDSTSGLVKDVADLKAVGATKTEASNTNGNIKINNVETTVYDDTALAGRVTTAEGAISALQNEGFAHVNVVSSLPATVDTDDLYMIELA